MYRVLFFEYRVYVLLSLSLPVCTMCSRGSIKPVFEFCCYLAESVCHKLPHVNIYI